MALKFKKGNALVLATISLKGVNDFAFKIDGPWKTVEDTDNEGNVRMENGKPVLLHPMPVTNLETGEQGEIVVGFMVRKALQDATGELDPANIGKTFVMERGATKGRTVMWNVYPITLEK